jgi:hypothetical protein
VNAALAIVPAAAPSDADLIAAAEKLRQAERVLHAIWTGRPIDALMVLAACAGHVLALSGEPDRLRRQFGRMVDEALVDLARAGR